ncbi:MAG: hypothetical protein C4523_06910 [Myxococcales bacterium]|nr:MAG: hypothetical protein C4523_06910 [Myxococcales bacterium]
MFFTGCEAEDSTSNGAADGDQSAAEGDQVVTDGDDDGRATDGDESGEEPTDGDRPVDGDVDGDVVDGELADGDRPDGDTIDGDNSDGDTTDGDTTDGDSPDGDIEADVDEDADSSACLEIPAPDPVPLECLEGVWPPGRTESTRVNGYNDDYMYSSDDSFKIGIREDWGATIIFFGEKSLLGWPGVNNTNVIDGNDTGREVQIALYDPDRSAQGCAWNASCRSNPGAACPLSIRYLGWNPVQGGNRCNLGSGVESVTMADGVLDAQVRPYHWNPDWEAQSCSSDSCGVSGANRLQSEVQYNQRLRFVGSHVVEVQMEVINLSEVSHAVTLQEFPTLYATWGDGNTPDLRVIMDSEGNQIPIDQPANDGFFWKEFDSPGGWAALQNTERNYGVGIYYENRLRGYQGWQKYGVFNNIRSRFHFGLAAHGTVRARAYLMLGSYATISGLAAELDATLPPFGALDSPLGDATVSGSFSFHGWVLDNKGVSSVRLLIDGAPVAAPSLDQNRPDVCLFYPGYAQCDRVGFAGSASLAEISACPHWLEVEATDGDGNTRIVARKRIFVN